MATAAIPVTRALEAAGADGFCVATFDEAVALRDAGIRRPILVLYPIPPALADAARRASIAVTAGEPLLPGALAGGARSRRRTSPRRAPRGGDGPRAGRVHGLGARGRRAARRGNAGPRIAGAVDPLPGPRGPRSHRPAGRAVRGSRPVAPDRRDQLPGRHVTASSGLLLDGVVSLEGVRPGLATYGLIPDELSGAPAPATVPGATGLRPILSLRARPVRVADLPAGHGISYGPTFTTTRPSRIATLPLGYGDGWPRALSNRASALVRGRRVPLVGNVAMDAVMADVTDVDGPPVSVDDEFVLLGSQEGDRITAAEIAAAREHELVGGRDESRCSAASGVPCGLRSAGDADPRRARSARRVDSSGQIGVRRSTRP